MKMSKFLVISLVLSVLFALTACGVTKAQVEDILAQTQGEIDLLQQQETQIAESLAALPEGDPLRTEWALKFQRVRSLIAEAEVRAEKLDRLIAEIPEDEGPAFVLDSLAAIAATIGGPYGLAAAGALGVGAAYWRQRVGLVQGAERMARAIDRTEAGSLKGAMVKDDLLAVKVLASDPDPVVAKATRKLQTGGA